MRGQLRQLLPLVRRFAPLFLPTRAFQEQRQFKVRRFAPACSQLVTMWDAWPASLADHAMSVVPDGLSLTGRNREFGGVPGNENHFS